MSELDLAGQRIEAQRKAFEPIKPLLVGLEEQALEKISPRVTSILQEAKAYIAQKEGITIYDSVYVSFHLRNNDSEVMHSTLIGSDGQRMENWWKGIKIEGEPRPVTKLDGIRAINQIYSTSYYWVSVDRPLEIPVGVDASHVSENVSINRIVFFLSSRGKQSLDKPEIEVRFVIDDFDQKVGPSISYDEKVGILQRRKLGVDPKDSNFLIKTDEGINRFAESVYFFLHERNYCDSEAVAQVAPKKIQANTKGRVHSITNSEYPVTQTRGIIDDINEARWRAAQDDQRERERVILEIQRRMREDPNYKRPSWISEEAINLVGRGDFGRIQTEGDRYPSEDSFQSSLQRHFPPGPNF